MEECRSGGGEEQRSGGVKERAEEWRSGGEEEECLCGVIDSYIFSIVMILPELKMKVRSVKSPILSRTSGLRKNLIRKTIEIYSFMMA